MCCGMTVNSADSKEARAERKRQGSVIGEALRGGVSVGKITGETFQVLKGQRVMLHTADVEGLVAEGAFKVVED